MSVAATLAPPLIRKLRLLPAERLGYPIAPGGVPLLGHIPALITHLPAVMEGGQALGDFFWLNLGGSNWLLTSGNEEIFNAFRNRETSSDELPRIAKDLITGTLLELDGPMHKRIRSVMNGPFTPAGLTANGAGEVIAEVVKRRISRWSNAQKVNLYEDTREIAIDVIFRMIGIPSFNLAQWRVAFEDSIKTVFALPIDVVGSSMRKGRLASEWLSAQLGDVVREARSRPEEATLLSGLIHGKDEDGVALNDAELIANLKVLALAGHETTASTMAWMLLALGERPELWSRLVKESLAAAGPPMNPEQLKQVPLAEALFREALRLYPPVPLDVRRVAKPMSMLGKELPVNTKLGVGIRLLSKNATRYPEPDAFNPDRWLTAAKKPSPIETVQFGGGPHFCLGYHVAVLEGVHFIVAVAREFGGRGLKPVIANGVVPEPVWFPITRPPKNTFVRFVPDGTARA
ncbi:MAG: cytochrome P450 [Myxococcaceae bacterium]